MRVLTVMYREGCFKFSESGIQYTYFGVTGPFRAGQIDHEQSALSYPRLHNIVFVYRPRVMYGDTQEGVATGRSSIGGR